MATVILECGPVTASGPLASVVGGGNQWADGSDATYGQFGPFGPAETPAEILQAPLAATPFAGVISAELFIRTDNTDPGGSLIRASVAGLGWTTPEVKSQGSFGGTFDVAPGISERFQPLTGLVGAASIAEVFAQPAAVFITWAAVSNGSRLRILEAHVVVTIADADETYRRIYPRDDGLAGGAARNWPPSKSSQSGLRTSGGYF